MADFKIAYVDESEADIRDFQRFNYRKGQYFKEIVPIKPVPDLQELVSDILAAHCDAVVVDFRLSEEAPEIQYDGGDVVKVILEERPNFPVFILTSYEEDAAEQGPDANIVNEKKVFSDEEPKLLVKIERQIKKYRSILDETEKNLLSLLKTQSERSLSATEEEELVRLDSFIQKSLGKSMLPDSSKLPSNNAKLIELLKKADEILNKFDTEK